jgi:hypothetical protein
MPQLWDAALCTDASNNHTTFIFRIKLYKQSPSSQHSEKLVQRTNALREVSGFLSGAVEAPFYWNVASRYWMIGVQRVESAGWSRRNR